MEKRHTLTLDKEFILYCELNNIKDINKIANETFNRGFSLLKYGETPFGNSTEKEKIVEIIKEVMVEKIVEVIKEVPVEVIREVPIEKIVEVIKEVPIEVKGDTQIITNEVIKEIPVEIIKEVIIEVPLKIVDTKEVDRLNEENIKLKEELEKLTNALNKFNKGSFMKNSDLNSLYDE